MAARSAIRSIPLIPVEKAFVNKDEGDLGQVTSYPTWIVVLGQSMEEEFCPAFGNCAGLR